jgi:flavodoxin
MSTLFVYDSNYGNTRLVAEQIASALGTGTAVVYVGGLTPERLIGVELLVVGSPIIGWRPSPRMQAFLDQLGVGMLHGVRAAAFDTRVRLVIHGDAAGKISHTLEKAGAHIVAKPHGFIVDGREGPLAAGELDKVTEWAGSIVLTLRH